MGFTNAFEATILNHFLGGTAVNPPASYSLALCTGVTEAGAITGEPSGNGYQRVTIANNTSNFPATTLSGTVSEKRNGTAFAFPKATGSWGTLTHWVLLNGSTPWMYGSYSATVINNNDTVSFDPNGLTIRLD